MIIAIGKDCLRDEIYDEDSLIRRSVYKKLESIMTSIPKGQVICLGKYKNGISMDFCEICAKINALNEVVVPYEDNDNSWPAPVKNKFKEILKKSKHIKLLSRGAFNPKKLRDMENYVDLSSDIIINIEIVNHEPKITIERKNELKISKGVVNKFV